MSLKEANWEKKPVFSVLTEEMGLINDTSSIVLVKSTSDLISQDKSRKFSNNLYLSSKIFLDT